MDREDRDIFSKLQMKGHLLHRARGHLKIPFDHTLGMQL